MFDKAKCPSGEDGTDSCQGASPSPWNSSRFGEMMHCGRLLWEFQENWARDGHRQVKMESVGRDWKTEKSSRDVFGLPRGAL